MKVYQLLAHGRWFSPGTPDSSTTKTGRHDKAEIVLKVALNTKKIKSNQIDRFIYDIMRYILSAMSCNSLDRMIIEQQIMQLA